MKYVKITWNNTVGDNDWCGSSNLDNMAPRVDSVGWVVAETSYSITISSSWHVESGKFFSPLRIPLSSVISMTILGDTSR